MGYLRALAQDINLNLPPKVSGRVVSARGPIVLANLPQAAIGDVCQIQLRSGDLLLAKVLGFDGELISLAPLGELTGITPGALVTNQGAALKIQLPKLPCGSVIDPLGKLLGSPGSELNSGSQIILDREPPCATSRQAIDRVLETGVRSIDAFCTLGRGQRIGLFASAGTGKSTLLGMLARNTNADINVIALVGERGREVNDFIENSLGEVGLQRSIVVVSTSADPPLKRSLAALTATAIAEHFRDQGLNVLLLVDSLTRVARAIRDVTLAAGEIPVRQGFTPSVYAELPKLLERAGSADRGTITAIYTVLTNGENESDPLVEELKSLLDGHLILSSDVAQRGIRPALDVSASISRLAHNLQSSQQREAVKKILRAIHRLKRDRDLLLFGGTPDKELSAALAAEPMLIDLLSQSTNESTCLTETQRKVLELAAKLP